MSIAKSISVSSSGFEHGFMIPSKYTCQGENTSPEISWDTIPGTREYVIIMIDPDVPHRFLPLATWVHWVVYNIPDDVTHLPEGVPKTKTLNNGACQGKTSFKDVGYGGPCPPFGTHRTFLEYMHWIVILIFSQKKAAQKQIKKAMKGHILAKGGLMGTYKKK